MADFDDRSSVLSHGEREIAALVRDGHSVDDIATTRDATTTEVEKALDRIHEKTTKAVATLLQSPYTADAVTELDADARASLRSALDSRD
jgi:DNA-binding NarL/FixJ family response regulator